MAGCTLADIVGEWFLFFVPVAIGGSILAGTWVVDYLLALAFGIGFQYAAIRGMERTLPRGEAIRRAAKADILSLTAWQAGQRSRPYLFSNSVAPAIIGASLEMFKILKESDALRTVAANPAE